MGRGERRKGRGESRLCSCSCGLLFTSPALSPRGVGSALARGLPSGGSALLTSKRSPWWGYPASSRARLGWGVLRHGADGTNGTDETHGRRAGAGLSSWSLNGTSAFCPSDTRTPWQCSWPADCRPAALQRRYQWINISPHALSWWGGVGRTTSSVLTTVSSSQPRPRRVFTLCTGDCGGLYRCRLSRCWLSLRKPVWVMR